MEVSELEDLHRALTRVITAAVAARRPGSVGQVGDGPVGRPVAPGRFLLTRHPQEGAEQQADDARELGVGVVALQDLEDQRPRAARAPTAMATVATVAL